MAKRVPLQPTKAELEVLKVLWDLGPSSVREVFRTLSQEQKGPSYTTVLTFMQILHRKGFLERDDTVRPQVYRAVRSRHRVQRNMIGDLISRLFDGALGSFVLQALSTRKTTPEERREIRALLDELDRDTP